MSSHIVDLQSFDGIFFIGPCLPWKPYLIIQIFYWMMKIGYCVIHNMPNLNIWYISIVKYFTWLAIHNDIFLITIATNDQRLYLNIHNFLCICVLICNVDKRLSWSETLKLSYNFMWHNSHITEDMEFSYGSMVALATIYHNFMTDKWCQILLVTTATGDHGWCFINIPIYIERFQSLLTIPIK